MILRMKVDNVINNCQPLCGHKNFEPGSFKKLNFGICDSETKHLKVVAQIKSTFLEGRKKFLEVEANFNSFSLVFLQ